jgi:hypothetical protein
MATNALNQIYKSAVLALEQATVTADVAIAATAIPIVCKVMTQTPFIAGDGRPYMIKDDTWKTGANGLPNAERFTILSITGETVVPLLDTIGWTYTATLEIQAYSSSGWSGGLVNAYTQANHAVVLMPGVEMAIQSSDFNCRFKTLSDAPKIEFDDESSRMATGDEGRDLSIAGARTAEITFTEKMSWAGSVTTVPAWDKIMKSCGHLKKTYGSTGFEYLPTIYANEITATIWVMAPENGLSPSSTCYRYCGAHGGNGTTISVGKIGDPYMITAKYSAAYVGTMEIPLASARTFATTNTETPEVLLNNLVYVPTYINGSPSSKYVEVSQFSLDFGGVVNPFIDQSTSTGYAYYATQDREPKLTINPYHVRKGLDDVDNVVTNMIAGLVTIQSQVTSPHITIEICRGQLLSPTIGSREGYVSTERTYRALRNNLGNGASDNAVPDNVMYGILIGARA